MLALDLGSYKQLQRSGTGISKGMMSLCPFTQIHFEFCSIDSLHLVGSLVLIGLVLHFDQAVPSNYAVYEFDY